MNYKVLYRKYRPGDFDSVVGQNNSIMLLKDSVINEKISHAYIFSGPRGTGKTSTAKIFAKAINCLCPKDGNPCGECDNCRNFASSNDIYEIDAASNNGVDQIREIVENIKLTPINLKYKVYIIDEVHMLSISAFNALLLTLEEPPKHAVFILATTDIEDVPITVLSRCQRLDFKKIKAQDIEGNIKDICAKEKIEIEESAISEIASYSDGGMRDALSILDQLSKTSEKITQDMVLKSIGVISNEKVKELVKYYIDEDVENIVKFVDQLRESSVDFKSLIKKTIRQVRLEALEVLRQKNDNSCYEKYKKLCFDLSNLVYKINVNVDVYTLFEFTLLPTVEKYINIAEDTPKNHAKLEKIKQEKSELKTVAKEKEISKILTPPEDKLMQKSTPSVEDNSQNIVPVNDDQNKLKNIKLIDIRINNCFASASKIYLNNFKKQWDIFMNTLSNKKIKGLLLDVEIVLASDKIAVLNSKFSDIVNKINTDLEKIEDIFQKNTSFFYKFIAIDNEYWNTKMDEYKKNIKNGKKYTIIKEPDNILDDGVVDDVFTSSKIEVQ